MCLILFSYEMHPIYRLVIAANRDEYYDRSTEPASFWTEHPDLLAGKDNKAGGTWLGLTKKGQWAAITNFRDPANFKINAVSRGMLVNRFLMEDRSPRQYVESLGKVLDSYNGFNLLMGNPSGIYYFSSFTRTLRKLSPGLYGISNHLLNTPWPKVKRGKKALSELLKTGTRLNPEDVFSLLSDRIQPDDSQLPDTGIGIQCERLLSTIFITSNIYGTRSSMVVLIDRENQVDFRERTYNSHQNSMDERHFEFRITESNPA